jgi:hypothetical protein
MSQANRDNIIPTGARVFDPPQFRKRRALDAKLRERIEAAVEKLIETLDATEDTDTDTQNDDYPIDDNELEPSLGSTDNARDQTKWAPPGSWNEDREGDEHDGREPDVDDEEDDPGEDNGDTEPSLGWTSEPTLERAAAGFVVDGEEGDLSVEELDRHRAERRPQNSKVQQPESIGDDPQLVMVTRRGQHGTICNVRPLTPDERAAELRKAGIVSAQGDS